MKYNLSEIMKHAWALRKGNGMNMSEALKTSWACAKSESEKKEEVKMRGTEKQIKWASDLLGAMNEKFAEILDFVKANQTKQQYDEMNGFLGTINSILTTGDVYAGDIIDILKGCDDKNIYDYYSNIWTHIQYDVCNGAACVIKKTCFEERKILAYFE